MITRKPIGEQPFTTFANNLLNDESLTAEALGVLVYLLSKPGNWNVLPGPLGKRFGCGRDKIYRIMGELIEAGYATREADRDIGGVIRGWNYLVSNEKEPLPEKPEVGDEPLPEEATSGKSAPQKKDSSKKERPSRPAKQDTPYSEEFENDVWKPYPRKAGTSKKKAWDMFRMLTEEKQQAVKTAIPVYAEMMRREGRPEDKIKHLQFWISERIYETISAATLSTTGSGGGPNINPANWHKTATREQWTKVLQIWRMDNNWRLAWGPAPGRPGCGVPADLLKPGEGEIAA